MARSSPHRCTAKSTGVVKGFFTRRRDSFATMSGDLRDCAWITASQELSTEASVSKSRVKRLCHIVPGVFTPVLAKHSKSFSLLDCLSVGVDRMQRNFEPMRKQVEAWQKSELTDVTAKVVTYEAFVEGKLEAPKHLARSVHELYFEPKYKEFRPRTIWSLSNAVASAFKELDPIPQFRATAKLGKFLETRFSQSF